MLCRFLLFCILFIPLKVFSQSPDCNLIISTYKGCVPQPVNFDVTTTDTGTITGYLWNFGNSQTSTQRNPTHVFQSRGSFRPSITITFSDGRTCTKILPQNLNIFDNPKADFNISSSDSIILCNRGEKFCFKDMTKPGADGAPAVSWLWNFGEGGTSNSQNPCYAWSDSGTYEVSLLAIDSNGCQNLTRRFVKVRYAGDLGLNLDVKFKASARYDCKTNTTEVTYTNETDTTDMNITKFTWNFDDGTTKTCDLTDPGCLQEWLVQKRTYNTIVSLEPTLTVENRYGCTGDYSMDTAVLAAPYKLYIKYFPATIDCYAGDSIIDFESGGHPTAQYFWTFDDSTGVGRTPVIRHTFTDMRSYNIRLRVRINECEYDTCFVLNLNGPKALIMPSKGRTEEWDKMPLNGTGQILPKDMAQVFDTTCNGKDTVYYRWQKVQVPNGDTLWDWCNATISGYDDTTRYICGIGDVKVQEPVYRPKVAATRDTFTYNVTKHTWQYGTPLPTGDIYISPPPENKPHYYEDTTLFPAQCGAPYRFTFTNFSQKYRGYDAVDNFPLRDYRDSCNNPSWPYASDSLTFTWDFKEGAHNGTSTPGSVDETARYSTERTPSHLFTKDGCYWVELEVIDPVTNCLDIDSIPIVLQEPDAGPEDKFDSLGSITWVQQEQIGKGKGRRGMIIQGLPCVGEKQQLYMKETLPSCYTPYKRIVWDSASDIQDPLCDPNDPRFKWSTKDEYQYADTGWKSVGMVIANNSFCVDSAWFHNYKYIHGLFPALSFDQQYYCPGDTVKASMLIPNQPGIKLIILDWAVEGKRYDTLAKYRDTIPYQVITRPDGTKDTITSTTHEPLWGLDDESLSFNHLFDTIRRVIPMNGHVSVKTRIYNRFGCKDSTVQDFAVGHYAEALPSKYRICAGESIEFFDFVRYYLPYSVHNPIGMDLRDFWGNSDSFRNGRPPQTMPEQLFWDMDGDSTIDDTGSRPVFQYNTPGQYTVVMHTRDSMGCKRIIEYENLIDVIDIDASFSIDTPGALRFCAPHFYKFRDSSFAFNPKLNRNDTNLIILWRWDFGDGTPTLTISDRTKKNVSHLYTENGTYQVKLTVFTAPNGGGDTLGCASSITQEIKIIGPTADFVPISPTTGCAPLTVKFLDRSHDARIREWRLGDSTIQSSSGEDTVTLVYTKPGTFCPQLIVADTIRDVNDSLFYCIKAFPEMPCLYTVVVHKPNTMNLIIPDSVLCRGQEGIFIVRPDTGYASWTIDWGDGTKTTQNGESDFYHTYQDTGAFELTLSGEGALCPQTATGMVRVVDVLADFSWDVNRSDTPNFVFLNESENGVRYMWDFGDGEVVETMSAGEIQHRFKRTGLHRICLKAWNAEDCPDETCKELTIVAEIFIPNVFTPNGDNYNDVFRIPIRGDLYYNLYIYNRWGELVFHSENPDEVWDGTHQDNPDRLHPSGTYYAVFEYELIGGKREKYSGTVTLLRE